MPMEASMSTADVPVGTSQISSSKTSIDELLRQYEVHSAWKLISMPNLTALCYEHKLVMPPARLGLKVMASTRLFS